MHRRLKMSHIDKVTLAQRWAEYTIVVSLVSYLPDLSKYAYFDSDDRPMTKNIGWLGKGHDFPQRISVWPGAGPAEAHRPRTEPGVNDRLLVHGKTGHANFDQFFAGHSSLFWSVPAAGKT